MGKRIKVGEQLPFFQYDTPYSEANSFRTHLLEEQAPLVLVFMSNSAIRSPGLLSAGTPTVTTG